MSAGWAALAGCVLGKKEKLKIKPCAYYLCIAGNWFIMVWMVWIQCRLCLRANGIAVQALGTTTVSRCRCRHGLGILDKILGHKLSAMGACIGTVVGLVAITPAAGFSMPHAIFIGIFSIVVTL
jgi:Amt family ammonium transporter